MFEEKTRHLLAKIFEYLNFLVSRNRNVSCDFGWYSQDFLDIISWMVCLCLLHMDIEII